MVSNFLGDFWEMGDELRIVGDGRSIRYPPGRQEIRLFLLRRWEISLLLTWEMGDLPIFHLSI